MKCTKHVLLVTAAMLFADAALAGRFHETGYSYGSCESEDASKAEAEQDAMSKAADTCWWYDAIRKTEWTYKNKCSENTQTITATAAFECDDDPSGLHVAE